MKKLNRLASRKIFAAFVLVIAAWAMVLPASGSLQGINSGLASYSNPPVIGFGNAPIYAPAQPVVPNSIIVAMAATPDGKGYWLVGSDGSVYPFGDAQSYGSTANLKRFKA